MKIRQRYTCDQDEMIVRFEFSKKGHIINAVEISSDTPLQDGELTMPRMEVSGEQFKKMLYYDKLR